MYLTIRGREYTKSFDFAFAGQRIDVDSVQIEVDAGYEALSDIVLLEAKIGLPTHFNIRQLYYPYRHFAAIVPQKRVRTVFLAYDIPTSTYNLFEYGFAESSNPFSIRLERCGIYKIGSAQHHSVYDLLDTRFETRTAIVPQADDLNKVFELLTLVEAGLNRAEDVADYFVFDKRQSNYYREAAEYLGLIRSSRANGYLYSLTDLGILVLSEPTTTRATILAKVIVNSWIFLELIDRSRVKGFFTVTDIEETIASAKTVDGEQHYRGTTVGRRRHTVTTWLEWLSQEIGCFVRNNNGYALK